MFLQSYVIVRIPTQHRNGNVQGQDLFHWQDGARFHFEIKMKGNQIITDISSDPYCQVWTVGLSLLQGSHKLSRHI